MPITSRRTLLSAALCTARTRLPRGYRAAPALHMPSTLRHTYTFPPALPSGCAEHLHLPACPSPPAGASTMLCFAPAHSLHLCLPRIVWSAVFLHHTRTPGSLYYLSVYLEMVPLEASARLFCGVILFFYLPVCLYLSAILVCLPVCLLHTACTPLCICTALEPYLTLEDCDAGCGLQVCNRTVRLYRGSYLVRIWRGFYAVCRSAAFLFLDLLLPLCMEGRHSGTGWIT